MGGAKNCPETPRQKMIGMMYLVLTAMLALNVSTDILNGFTLVDNSLHSSIDATDERNHDLMADFKYDAEQNPDKNLAWYEKAIELEGKSDSLYNYIHNFKYEIAKLADGAEKADPDARKIEGNSNLDVTGQYAIVQGNGTILKEKIIEYKDYLIALSDSANTSEFETLFATNDGATNDGTTISWEASLFEGMPVGASITLLTKIQSDIRTAENKMIQYLRRRTDASDLRVNKMEALVIPSSKYVIQGSKYSAQIVLAAVDTTQKPTYYINGNRIGDNGIYEFTANGIGAHTYKGTIDVMGPDGGMISYPFESDYSVGEPSVTISNTDLNIMYRDYDNKFSISVPGVANDKLNVKVNGATVKRQGGMWLIRPTGKAKEVSIIVTAELDGRTENMGEGKYRVKELPKPGAYFKSGNAEYSEGRITRNALLNDDASIIASYGPDGLLDLKYTITSFQLQTPMGLKPSQGNKFTKQQVADLKKLKKGAMITIVDIRAKGQEGKEIRLRGIPLTLD